MKKLIVLSVAALLTACSTPYQSYGIAGGYQDEEIAEGEYYLRYVGNGFTSNEKVKNLWHQRARELCNNKYSFEYQNNADINHTVFAGGAAVPLFFPQLTGKVTCSEHSEK